MNRITNLIKRFIDLRYITVFRNHHNTTLELLWNILPIICLIIIAGPSFVLLYLIEDFIDISFLVKITGNQWYWSYEFINQKLDNNVAFVSEKQILFDSVMLTEMDLIKQKFGFRLLEVDNRLKLLYLVNTSFLISSTDVLHSWAIPSLGLKIDACPGRINRLAVWTNRKGVYYGQCSEICGINHAYMPIVCVVT